MNSAKKSAAFLSTTALAAGAAHGAILYTPLNVTLSQHGALSLDLNQDGSPDFQIAFNASAAAKPYITNAPPALTTPFVLSSGANQGLPVTTAGALVNGSYQSAQNVGYFNKNSGATAVGSWTAAGNVEGYVGLELTDGSGTHYGWAHFIYNATAIPPNDNDTGVLTLVDAAMETAAGTAILAGQTAEAGVAPVINLPPSSQTGYLGGTAKLTVNAAGFPSPTFKWQAGAVGGGIYTNLPNGGGVTDGANNSLTLTNLKLANQEDYVVVVSNVSGAITSSVPATLTVVPASDTPATLVHRYSFQDPPGNSTFADSVGGSDWDGFVTGDATLTGTSLVLDGTYGTVGALPPYITGDYTQMTVEFWVDVGNNPAWTRVFFFGDLNGSTKNSGVDYSAYAGGNFQNLDLLNLSQVDSYANNPAGLNNTVGDHITVVVDSVNGALCYYNGTNVVSTLNSAVPSLADINDAIDVLGASPVSADPYLNGTFHEFRVYQGVLSPQTVALNDAVGPANYFEISATPTISAVRSGSNTTLTWPVSNLGFAVQSRSSLATGSWTTLTNAPVLAGTNWQVSISSTNAPQFYQLIHK